MIQDQNLIKIFKIQFIKSYPEKDGFFIFKKMKTSLMLLQYPNQIIDVHNSLKSSTIRPLSFHSVLYDLICF
jgi:hypothetical protein